MFRAEFKTDNMAFDDEPATETARILREISGRIERGDYFDGTVYDANGNSIGEWKLDAT